MGLLSDALRHLLATDPAERRAGLAGLVGRAFGAEPLGVAHPSAPTDQDFDVVHYPKILGFHPRSFAITATLGLADTQGRELLATTLADARDPARDKVAWLLRAVAAANPERGVIVALPPGCLGRSSHDHALLTAPFVFPDRDLPDYERIAGARLELCVPVTAREADWIAERGADAYFARMREQGVAPHADRAAGLVDLG
jgi:hypothetical protein